MYTMKLRIAILPGLQQNLTEDSYMNTSPGTKLPDWLTVGSGFAYGPELLHPMLAIIRRSRTEVFNI